MNTNMNISPLNSEEALLFIEKMKYSYNRTCEEFDILFDFLYEEVLADQAVLFALVDLAKYWNVLDTRYEQLYSLFQGKSQFIEYLNYFSVVNHDDFDVDLVHLYIIEQIKLWNQYSSALKKIQE